MLDLIIWRIIQSVCVNDDTIIIWIFNSNYGYNLRVESLRIVEEVRLGMNTAQFDDVKKRLQRDLKTIWKKTPESRKQ